MTYYKQSDSHKLSITLNDLNIDERCNYHVERTSSLDELFCDLTIYAPTSQSHYGKKLESYTKLNNRTQNDFLKHVFNGLGIKNVYLYKTFSDKTRNKKDIYGDVVKDQGTMLCLRCDNGVVNSLYMSIRNAIAHGNIIQKAKSYILYSVNDDANEYQSNVTFFLRITKLSNLKALLQILEMYR